MHPNRQQKLKEIINFTGDFKTHVKNLSEFDWDYDGEPILLNQDTLKHALNIYLNGKIRLEELFDWADFLELREDIDYPNDQEEVISNIMNELANPDMHPQLNHQRIKQFIAML